jgi:hypothetical protein
MEEENVLFAVFHSEREVRNALQDLVAAGIERLRISVYRPEQLNAQGFKYEPNTELKEGILVGAMIGTIGGMVIGLFSDRFPWLTSVSTNPIDVTLACALGGCLLGALGGALVGLGTPEHLARRYARYLSQGEILLAVHLRGELKKVETLNALVANGGFEVEPKREQEILPTIARHWYRDKKHSTAH